MVPEMSIFSYSISGKDIIRSHDLDTNDFSNKKGTITYRETLLRDKTFFCSRYSKTINQLHMILDDPSSYVFVYHFTAHLIIMFFARNA